MSKTKHGLCIYVENEFGVIQRVTNLFSARGMSMDSIHTTPVDITENISQISISLVEDSQNVELVQKLLMRLMIVHEVHHIKIPTVENTLYISHVFHVHRENSSKIIKALQQYDLTVFNPKTNPKIFCITGLQSVVEAFIKNVKSVPSFVSVKKYSPF